VIPYRHQVFKSLTLGWIGDECCTELVGAIGLWIQTKEAIYGLERSFCKLLQSKRAL
jgi:hypothetical protein